MLQIGLTPTFLAVWSGTRCWAWRHPTHVTPIGHTVWEDEAERTNFEPLVFLHDRDCWLRKHMKKNCEQTWTNYGCFCYCEIMWETRAKNTKGNVTFICSYVSYLFHMFARSSYVFIFFICCVFSEILFSHVIFQECIIYHIHIIFMFV